MSHQIRQQRQIVKPLKKALGKAVAERMWVNDCLIDSIPGGQYL